MHLHLIHKLLSEYNPAQDHQVRTKRRFCDFINTYSGCFERSLTVSHITGSAFITDRTRRRMILVHHKKLNMWLQPGGHADGETNILLVAVREAMEETGLQELQSITTEIFDLDIHSIPRHHEVSEHLHYDVRFLFEAGDAAPISASSESHEALWVELAEIGSYTQEESILRMIRKLPANIHGS